MKNLYKKYFDEEYLTIIDDISSNFYQLDEKHIIDMNSIILQDVLNSKKLRIETEDNLLLSLLHRRTSYLQNHQNQEEQSEEDVDFFIDKVQFEF